MMGGFFGLELPEYDNFPYREGPCCTYTNSGRAAFECLLRNMPRPSRIWIPRFICDTMLQAPERLQIPIERYECDYQLHPILPEIGEDELVLLVNYFGLTGNAVSEATEKLRTRCVIDATTALYCPPPAGVPAVYSPRKFSGLADGGVTLAPFPLSWLPAATDCSTDKSLYLLEQLENGSSAALPACEKAEQALSTPPLGMSRLTRKLIRSIDYNQAAAQRLRNYSTLHRGLKHINRLNLPDTPEYAPMCYPLICSIPDLRDTLIEAGIALPLYWPEVIETTEAFDTANELARRLLPLPLDQRYSDADMERLIHLILG